MPARDSSRRGRKGSGERVSGATSRGGHGVRCTVNDKGNENQGIRRDSHGDVTRKGFAVDETMPGFVSLVGDPHDLVLVLGITGEGDLVLGLAVGGPVDPGRVRMRWMQYRRRTRDLPLSPHVPPRPSSSILTQPSIPQPTGSVKLPQYRPEVSVLASEVAAACPHPERGRQWLGLSEQFLYPIMSKKFSDGSTFSLRSFLRGRATARRRRRPSYACTRVHHRFRLFTRAEASLDPPSVLH
jgi:hypothetical protein